MSLTELSSGETLVRVLAESRTGGAGHRQASCRSAHQQCDMIDTHSNTRYLDSRYGSSLLHYHDTPLSIDVLSSAKPIVSRPRTGPAPQLPMLSSRVQTAMISFIWMNGTEKKTIGDLFPIYRRGIFSRLERGSNELIDHPWQGSDGAFAKRDLSASDM